MRTLHGFSILLLAALAFAACEPVVAPDAERAETMTQPLAAAQASAFTAASGTYAQTAVTSLDVRVAGRNTILERSSTGWISGTLNGTFEDEIRVVIHPNGKFDAQFTITCDCTVEGESGILEITATDTGQLTSPESGTFAGRAVITGGTNGLADLRGNLEIMGTVDVPTGLSTTTYSGKIRLLP
jgi:hypothetical protein